MNVEKYGTVVNNDEVKMLQVQVLPVQMHISITFHFHTGMLDFDSTAISQASL